MERGLFSPHIGFHPSWMEKDHRYASALQVQREAFAHHIHSSLGGPVGIVSSTGVVVDAAHATGENGDDFLFALFHMRRKDLGNFVRTQGVDQKSLLPAFKIYVPKGLVFSIDP